MQREDVWSLFDTSLKKMDLEVAMVLELLECLLCFDAWTRKPTYWKADDHEAAKDVEDAICTLMKMVTDRLPRDKGNGWKVPTFHALRHIVRDITALGALRNYMAEVPEHNHVRFAKRPGRASQKNYVTFERQAATRIADSAMIARAYEVYVGLYQPVIEDEDDITREGAGTVCTLQHHLDSHPTVSWCSTTLVQHLVHPDGLPQFALKHYGVTKLQMRTEYKGDNGLEIRCHPGYRGGSPWYDWVEVELPDDPINES
jgi:hypothetical protein